jgi:hypothetical protein
MLAILLAALLPGGYGCMQNNPVQNESAQNINDAALAYMEQRYGEKFEYVAPTGASYAQNGAIRMFVSCASLPGDIFVEVLKTDKDFQFADNYLAVKYKQQVSEAIQVAALDVFGDAFVIYEVLPQAVSPILPADSSFEEYCADPESGISARIYLPSTGFEDSLPDTFADKFQKTGIGASITLVAVDDSVFSSLSSLNSYDIGVSKYKYFAVISFDESGFKYLQREAY